MYLGAKAKVSVDPSQPGFEFENSTGNHFNTPQSAAL